MPTYQPPRVVVLGTVRELTAAVRTGTGDGIPGTSSGLSDHRLKQSLRPVDSGHTLELLVALPL